MKVLIVTGIFPPDAGGPANYIPAIAQAISNDHEVVAVVTLSDSLDHDDSRYPYPVVRLLRGQSRLRRQWRTIQTIRRLQRSADVAYLNGLVLEGMIATRILGRRPSVIKVVGDLIWERARNLGATTLDIDDFQMPGRKSFYWRALRGLQGLYTASADRVIVPSRYLAGVVAGWGVPADRIKVVVNAVTLPPPELNATHDHDVVTAARLVSWKGIDRLISVCGAHDWSLLVVGDGPERSRLEALAHQVNARVTFAGQVPKAEVAGQIRRARCFVLNSTYEGLPHIVLEAKLAGRPVIATAVGGTPETINDGVDGFLVPPADDHALAEALAKLLNDEGRRAEMARHGKQDAERRFSFEVMYRETVAVLAEGSGRG